MISKYNLTFSEIREISEKENMSWFGNDSFLSCVAHEMGRANRSYMSDNLNPSSEGNYLDDFLKVHGDEIASPIRFLKGSPHCVGRGLVFLDAKKMRRKFEDFLRKSSLEDMYAAMSAVNMIGTCEEGSEKD